MMILSKKDCSLLEEVVELDGNCLKSTRCKQCPLRTTCLPKFLNIKPPTIQQRQKTALNIITHRALIDENLTKEDLKDFIWDKK